MVILQLSFMFKKMFFKCFSCFCVLLTLCVVVFFSVTLYWSIQLYSCQSVLCAVWTHHEALTQTHGLSRRRRLINLLAYLLTYCVTIWPHDELTSSQSIAVNHVVCWLRRYHDIVCSDADYCNHWRLDEHIVCHEYWLLLTTTRTEKQS